MKALRSFTTCTAKIESRIDGKRDPLLMPRTPTGFTRDATAKATMTRRITADTLDSMSIHILVHVHDKKITC